MQVPIKEKIETIAKEIYGASDVKYSDHACEMINIFEKQVGFLPSVFCWTYIAVQILIGENI